MSVKPVRIARAAPLLVSESSPGVVSGDDVDWDTSSSASNAIPNNLQWKQPVTCATTGAITISTGLNSGDVIDGVTLADGDRVLVKDQALPKENGIYIVDASPFRSVDMDDPAEFPGALVWVTDGTANIGTMWYCTNTTDPVVDTDAVNFAQFNSPIPTGTYRLDIEGGQETINALGSVGATTTVDPTLGNIVTLTLTANCTATISAPVGSAGADIEWWVTQDGTGGWTFTVAATGGTVTDNGTLSPSTAAGVTLRYITDRVPGTSNDWVRDLVGGVTVPVAGTPALTLSTTNATGAAATFVATDATVAVFDATVPVTQALGDSAATGAAGVAARRDHKHGMPALSTATPLVESGAGAAGSGTLSSRDDHVHPAATPTGTGSVDHEHIMNLWYSGDGSTTVFELPAGAFDDQSVRVWVSGTLTDVTLSGALLTTMTFGSAPASATNNIVVDLTAAVV